MSDFRIREAVEADMPAVLSIYNQEVLEGVATFDLEPRSLEAQLRWLEEHARPYCAIVACDDSEVVGFGSLSPYHARPGYRFTVEDTVYVHRERRREGIGRLILAALIAFGREQGFHVMLGRIASENEASLALHRALGFEEAGREREVGHKFGRWLDVVTMQLILN
jgi:phosphinothricin acetyltransferase